MIRRCRLRRLRRRWAETSAQFAGCSLKSVRQPQAVVQKRLDKEQIDKLVALLEKIVDDAEACHEVTLAMLMKRSRTKACDRVVANALRERGRWFRDLRRKPILTPDDVKERQAFAEKYKDKSANWWRQAEHIHCDNHIFKGCPTSWLPVWPACRLADQPLHRTSIGQL